MSGSRRLKTIFTDQLKISIPHQICLIISHLKVLSLGMIIKRNGTYLIYQIGIRAGESSDKKLEEKYSLYFNNAVDPSSS